MSQGTVRDIEVGVVQGVKIAPTTLVYGVEYVRPYGTCEDGYFVLHINIEVVLCETNQPVNNSRQTIHAPSSSSEKNRWSFNWSSMFLIVFMVFLALAWS